MEVMAVSHAGADAKKQVAKSQTIRFMRLATHKELPKVNTADSTNEVRTVLEIDLIISADILSLTIKPKPICMSA